MKKALVALIMLVAATSIQANPIAQLMERISPGLSAKIQVVIEEPSIGNWFSLEQGADMPLIKASDPVSAAVGLNYYLKYVAHTPLTWDKMTANLPDTLPAVDEKVSLFASVPLRYYLNYCTHSYSMAFWDWERWEREIDWMALHGINMPLAITGSEALWQLVLRRIGYPEEKIAGFIAGPAFQAWWLMNNLEGWGGPVTDEYIDRQAHLQQRILERMRSYGMHPVLPGYCGMLPHDAATTLGVDVVDQGLWCGYNRPTILLPTDSAYMHIADVYYDELQKLYGTADYFSMDPFHEGGATGNTDLHQAAQAIVAAMKLHNPDAVWVAQGWQENPRAEILEAVTPGDMLILDLQAESSPMWCTRPGGFAGHNWAYCELLNFGGNQGLYGRISSLVSGYYKALAESPGMLGVGLTPEGIENNSMMYELLCELPWRADKVDVDKWVSEYARTRYGGVITAEIDSAWRILARSVYDCPDDSAGQGARESLFCARPARHLRTASAWAASTDYYDPSSTVERAAMLMCHSAPKYAHNEHFLYDYIDLVRQVIADRGRRSLKLIDAARDRGDKAAFRREADEFLRLLTLQDSLLALHPMFRLDTYINEARNHGATEAEKDLNEFNLRAQITTWGGRQASEQGRLHDYSNREWSGLLRDFYLPRWQRWFDHELEHWDNANAPALDFFAIEEPWSHSSQASPYREVPSKPCCKVAEVSRLLRRALN